VAVDRPPVFAALRRQLGYQACNRPAKDPTFEEKKTPLRRQQAGDACKFFRSLRRDDPVLWFKMAVPSQEHVPADARTRNQLMIHTYMTPSVWVRLLM
jgi:hypothetical protein